MFRKKKDVSPDEDEEYIPTAEVPNRRFDLFKSFNGIQQRRKDVKILEISVRQGQILIIFEKELIPLRAFIDLSEMARVKDSSSSLLPKYSSIGFIGENPSLIIDTNNFKSDLFKFSDIFQVLIDAIEYAADNICKCPALEIVFSDKYIKCYLDKPGITLEDVSKYEQMFNSKGTLELFGQRPYLLLINDNFEE